MRVKKKIKKERDEVEIKKMKNGKIKSINKKQKNETK